MINKDEKIREYINDNIIFPKNNFSETITISNYPKKLWKKAKVL